MSSRRVVKSAIYMARAIFWGKVFYSQTKKNIFSFLFLEAIFPGFFGRKVCQSYQNCIRLLQRGLLWKWKTFQNPNFWQLISQPEQEFSDFWQQVWASLSELYFNCPEEHFEQKVFFLESLWTLISLPTSSERT